MARPYGRDSAASSECEVRSRTVSMQTIHCRALSVLLLVWMCTGAPGKEPGTASLSIDAAKIENAISPTLYGQFAEFMFEDIKGGLYAELARDRGFNEAPNALGLPRYWERDPDDRDDDDALHFAWDASVYSPARGDANTLSAQHSIRVDIDRDDGRRRGIRQGWIPIRKGLEYHGYVWLKTTDYAGTITVALEADETGGERYASTTVPNVGGDCTKNSGLASRVHSLARRQRCAGLSLGVGYRPARSEAGLDQRSLAQRTGAERLRNRRVHPIRAASWI